MIEEFEAFYEDGILRLSRKRFDDCWYLELVGKSWNLLKIDQNGEPNIIDHRIPFRIAYERGLKLNKTKT